MDDPSNIPPTPGDPHDAADPTSTSGIEPAAGAPPGVVADELLAHGLLTYLHKDTRSRQELRVAKVMSTIDERSRPIGRLLWTRRNVRVITAAAACLALVAALTFLGLPGEQSAQATVERSIAAMQSSGDRRFEVRILAPDQTTLPANTSAIIDTRPPNLMLLRASTSEGREVVAGRDATGDWAIRLDGGIERTRPELAWPRWAKVGEETLLADSVDRLLSGLTKGYTLQRPADTHLDGQPDKLFHHVLGTKNHAGGPGGDHVEIWIDPATNIVERLEMRWDVATPQSRASSPAASSNNADQPPAARSEDGPGADDEPGQRARPPRGHPPHRRPPPPDDDDLMGGPPRPDHGARDNGEPGPTDQADQPGHPGATDGPVGPDDRAGPGRPPRGPGGPGARGGGPLGGGRGEHRGPPKLLIMQRVDTPALEAAWFTPEAHLAK